MQVTHQGTIDPETGEAIQTVYVLDDAVTEADEAEASARRQRILWQRIRSGNERKWVKAELVKRKRRALLQTARENKTKVDEQGIMAEEKHINTGLLKLEAEIRADAELCGESADACMERLRAEVAREEQTQAA